MHFLLAVVTTHKSAASISATLVFPVATKSHVRILIDRIPRKCFFHKFSRCDQLYLEQSFLKGCDVCLCEEI